MALVNRGASFRIFIETVYRFMCGVNAADLIATVEEVPDAQTRHFLNQVSSYNISSFAACDTLIHLLSD